MTGSIYDRWDAVVLKAAAMVAVERAAEAPQVLAAFKGFPNGKAEAGVHVHALEREAGRTKVDGAHSHVFVLPEGMTLRAETDAGDVLELPGGTVLTTEEDGPHQHTLMEHADALGQRRELTNDDDEPSRHRHIIALANGVELITNDGGLHAHELQAEYSAFDGTHHHVLQLGDDVELVSLTGAQWWELAGQPPQAESPPVPTASAAAAPAEPPAAPPEPVEDMAGPITLANALVALAGAVAGKRKITEAELAAFAPATKQEDELDAAWDAYHEAVNMTASELAAWSDSPCSHLASLDRSPIERNLELLSTPKAEWTERLVSNARKTVAFIERHLAQRPNDSGTPARAGCPSKRDIALRNWAFDPRKAGDSSVPPLGSTPEEAAKQAEHVHDLPDGGATAPARLGDAHVHDLPDGGRTGGPILRGNVHVHDLPDGGRTGTPRAVEGMAKGAAGGCIDTLGECFPQGTRAPLAAAARAHAVRLLKADSAAEERYVFGVVLVPNEPDAQGDIYDAREVEKAAHSFLEHFGARIKLMHKGKPVDGVVVIESYLSKAEEEHGDEAFPVGTWFLATRVVNDDIWEAVKNGSFTGFSMGGTALREPLGPASN